MKKISEVLLVSFVLVMITNAVITYYTQVEYFSISYNLITHLIAFPLLYWLKVSELQTESQKTNQ